METTKVESTVMPNVTNMQEGLSYLSVLNKKSDVGSNTLFCVSGLRNVVNLLKTAASPHLQEVIQKSYVHPTEENDAVKSVSKLWIRKGLNENKDCLDAMSKGGVQLSTIPNNVEEVNKWYEENTEGMIDKVLDEISNDDILIITDAFYFKGQWEKEFTPYQTVPGTFVFSNKILLNIFKFPIIYFYCFKTLIKAKQNSNITVQQFSLNASETF